MCWILNASQPVKHLIKLFSNIFCIVFSREVIPPDCSSIQIHDVRFLILLFQWYLFLYMALPAVFILCPLYIASTYYSSTASATRRRIKEKKRKLQRQQLTCCHSQKKLSPSFKFCAKFRTPDFWLASDAGEMSSPLCMGEKIQVNIHRLGCKIRICPRSSIPMCMKVLKAKTGACIIYLGTYM